MLTRHQMLENQPTDVTTAFSYIDQNHIRDLAFSLTEG